MLAATCLGVLVFADPIDWPALTQRPHAALPVKDIGLRLLLVTADRKPITTRTEWEKARSALHDAWLAWLARLGQPP